MAIELTCDPASLDAGPDGAAEQAVALRGAVDEASFHDAIATALDFPAHYGRNLDALWDCLTDRPPLTLVWWDWPQIAVHHARWWVRVLEVLSDWSERPGCRLVLPVAPTKATPADRP